jgi:hypothetical protein
MAVDGTWNLSLTTPMGTQTPTLTLTSAGESLTGTMDGAQGKADIEDGRVDGNRLSWAITAAQLGMKINFSATVDGDRMSGKAELGAFGEATFEGTRA